MDLIKQIAKKTIFIVIPLALLSSLIEPLKFPAGILSGGLLGFLNLRGLSWGVNGLLGDQKAAGRMIFLSIFRLTILFLVLSILIYLRLVNVFGLLIGFSVVFGLVIFEGLRYAKNLSSQSTAKEANRKD